MQKARVWGCGHLVEKEYHSLTHLYHSLRQDLWFEHLFYSSSNLCSRIVMFHGLLRLLTDLVVLAGIEFLLWRGNSLMKGIQCTPVFWILPVLLTQLNSVFYSSNYSKQGCWRLIHDWYCNVSSRVKVIPSWCLSTLKEEFAKALFSHLPFSTSSLVLLREKSLGLSINGLFLGAFAHADDIRTLASSIDDSKLIPYVPS